MKKYEKHLRNALKKSHAVANSLEAPDFPFSILELLQEWQRERLAASYADFLGRKRFVDAGHFFLDELYGGLDFRKRDQEVERVLPVMIRFLPDRMLHAMSRAFELQALSLDLDRDMAALLAAQGWKKLDWGRYSEIYRETGRSEDRQRQISMIYELGLELNELVHRRLVMRLSRLLRKPAHMAGFGHLQEFLEYGLRAFRAMEDGTEFIRAIRKRENEVMRRLLAGENPPLALKKYTQSALAGSV